MSTQTAPVTPSVAPQSSGSLKRFFGPENRYLAPIFITCILLAGHLSFGILESYQKTALAIVTSIAAELALGWLHPGALSCVLAVCGVQPAFDFLQVCLTPEEPSHLEPIELWNLRAPFPRAGDGFDFKHSVGKQCLADAGHLGPGLGDYLEGSPL